MSRIQLQAFGVAYGTAMVIAVGLLAVSEFLLAVQGGVPQAYFGLLIVAEPVRGAALAVFARRFR